jgi:folate-binding Fe-S cluster repair protein YgfZ
MTNPRLYDRAIIRLSSTEEGEDVRGFLQGLVTQDTAAELPLWAGLLTGCADRLRNRSGGGFGTAALYVSAKA